MRNLLLSVSLILCVITGHQQWTKKGETILFVTQKDVCVKGVSNYVMIASKHLQLFFLVMMNLLFI